MTKWCVCFASTLPALGMLLVAVGLCGYSQLRPEQARRLTGGGEDGMCKKELNCTAACERDGDTYYCKECRNGINYDDCVPGQPSDDCGDDWSEPRTCGVVYGGMYLLYGGQYQCITYIGGQGVFLGCLVYHNTACRDIPVDAWGDDCGV